MSRNFEYEELVVLLTSGISQRRMYFDDHPRVIEKSERFAARLHELVTDKEERCFMLGVAEGHFVHGGHFLVGPSLVGRNLIDFATKLHSGGFLFHVGTTPNEIRRFFKVAAAQKESLASLDEARALFAAEGIEHVEIAEPFGEDGAGADGQSLRADGEGSAATAEANRMIPVYQALFGAVELAWEEVGTGGDLDLDDPRDVAQRLLQVTDGSFTDIMQLVNYPTYDSYTVGHSVRVALMLAQVGEVLGLDEDFLRELATAGLLHDIGKAKIDDEILFKPGRLDDDERREMERHTTLGADLLMDNDVASPLVVAAAWGHHQRPDGKGYPRSRPWMRLCQATKLLHVCDVFEALTAIRPYKPAMTPRHAYEIMFRDRDSFDPAALSLFVRTMGLYPPGSTVSLTSGERGIVTRVGDDVERPEVRLTHNRDGYPLPKGEPIMLDLAGESTDAVEVDRLLMHLDAETDRSAGVPS